MAEMVTAKKSTNHKIMPKKKANNIADQKLP
jgi:hypothetical protein